ncbi:MAG TPA: hypothetical protein VFA09_18170 [Ktedonobacteraceae bacterium]|nr:hypothetical protein [Ktedonobacteraceae bacterium]
MAGGKTQREVQQAQEKEGTVNKVKTRPEKGRKRKSTVYAQVGEKNEFLPDDVQTTPKETEH